MQNNPNTNLLDGHRQVSNSALFVVDNFYNIFLKQNSLYYVTASVNESHPDQKSVFYYHIRSKDCLPCSLFS